MWSMRFSVRDKSKASNSSVASYRRQDTRMLNDPLVTRLDFFHILSMYNLDPGLDGVNL